MGAERASEPGRVTPHVSTRSKYLDRELSQFVKWWGERTFSCTTFPHLIFFFHGDQLSKNDLLTQKMLNFWVLTVFLYFYTCKSGYYFHAHAHMCIKLIYLPPSYCANVFTSPPILPCLRSGLRQRRPHVLLKPPLPPSLHQKDSKIQINIKIVLCVSKIRWTPLFSPLFAWIIQGR